MSLLSGFVAIPRLQAIADPRLREDALQRERQLLYVSLTRARDEVFVSWIGEPSQFLDDVMTPAQLAAA
ncbi:3'-5' exonuclease [Synechococcus sp. PCC 7336]|uniref:3'-5' exonuclease n=1 Tax=Synechococcus sp. PCC 7336 TaxID=195250 RepID=UPI0003795136|nr:3'-5' exonuclease [Synechococcus sp. PCC 7336]